MNENLGINALLIAIVALFVALNAWRLARRTPPRQEAKPKPCATLAPISNENTQYRGLDPVKTLARIKRLVEDSKIPLDLEGERHA
jgi:hypothetical protein